MIRDVNINDLAHCYEMETSAYAGDEAANREKVEKVILDLPRGVHRAGDRWRGYASLPLDVFIDKMIRMHKEAIHLICQTELIDFYARQEFANIGGSTSDHGGLSWHEMTLNRHS